MPTIYKETKEEELAKDFISFIFRDDKVKAYIEDQFAFPSVDTVVQDNAAWQVSQRNSLREISEISRTIITPPALILR